MNRAATLVGTLFVVAVGTGALAQKNPYRNYTEERFFENMRAAGRNYAAVTELLAKAEYEPAKAQLTRAREQLAITVAFWRDRKQDEAVKILREALRGMDDLDAALSRAPVEQSMVKAASQRLTAACEACHAQYRDQDPATKSYRIKPGSIK